MNSKHFYPIFYFIVGLVLFGALYTVAVTFIPIPKGNERFADTGHVFWLSTAVAGGIGYLLGSSVSKNSASGPQIEKADEVNVNNTTGNTNGN